jgi:hypothetical protein
VQPSSPLKCGLSLQPCLNHILFFWLLHLPDEEDNILTYPEYLKFLAGYPQVQALLLQMYPEAVYACRADLK